MKRILIVAVAAVAVALSAAVVYAQMGPGQMGPGMMGPGMMGPGMMGPGMMGPGMMGPGMMGPGMMGPGGGMGYGCSGEGFPAQSEATPVTEEKAKEVAQQYADQYLKGFTVDKVLPFTGRHGATMYSVELKGPKDELRILHVNPWGNVMPFGGPGRRVG